VTAFKEFEKVQALSIDLEAMEHTTENLCAAVTPLVTYSVELKRRVRHVVNGGRENLAPVRKRRKDRELRAAKARLKVKYNLRPLEGSSDWVPPESGS
jgi:hypothetical protein